MQPCFLRIVTSADGEESVFSQYAEMELTPLSAVLRYTQGDGRVLSLIHIWSSTTAFGKGWKGRSSRGKSFSASVFLCF